MVAMRVLRVSAALFSAALTFFPFPLPSPAVLNTQPALPSPNRLAAQTWRAVDELYYDRTFNGQDWFQLRQSVVKNRVYKSDEEVYRALDEMIAKLGDKYTRFLNPAQYSALMNSAVGELIGIGVELSNDENEIKNKEGVLVPNVEPSSPAFEAGVKAGDIISNVDGTSTKGLSAEETALLLRGKEGSKVSISVTRKKGNDKKEELNFTILRKPIKLRGVTSFIVKLKDGDGTKSVLVIPIRSFSTTTLSDVQSVFEKVHNSNEEISSIVLDLRNNGGGLLQGAVEVANVFLPPGKIVVYVVNKDGVSKVEQTLPKTLTSSDPSLPDLTTPLYILMNRNTASAAEVLSAALKENSRATLVGEQSFGKGIIQTLEEVGSTGAGVAVTIAKYETPNHNNINKVLLKLEPFLTFITACFF